MDEVANYFLEVVGNFLCVRLLRNQCLDVFCDLSDAISPINKDLGTLHSLASFPACFWSPLKELGPHLSIKGMTNESPKVCTGMSGERIASPSGRCCADERPEQMNMALITNGPGRRWRAAKVRASEMSNLFLRREAGASS